MALALTACGGSGDAAKSEGDGAAAGETTNVRFVTGGESGTYYAYGNVLAQYASNGDYGVKVTALSGNGSQANVQALQDDDADIAFCQSDVLAYAYEGPTSSRRMARTRTSPSSPTCIRSRCKS